MAFNKDKNKQQLRSRRQKRIRAVVHGTASRPRLSVFRSNRNIFAQLINDDEGKTLVSVSEKEVKGAVADDALDGGPNVKSAYSVGQLMAKRAKEKGIESVVFDRGGNAYHGRVKAVAEGARAGGLIV